MATIQQFEDLEIWENARKICNQINVLTKKSNFRKDFSLVDQIRRSSGSAMDNIAEGFERDGNREFIQFLNMSKGSIGETRSQLYRSFDYGYISEKEFEIHKAECLLLSKQIRGFSNYLRKCEYKGHKFK